MTKLRVLVLCFSYFMDNSNASGVGEFSKELPTPDGAEGRLIWELPRSEGFTERKNGWNMFFTNFPVIVGGYQKNL